MIEIRRTVWLLRRKIPVLQVIFLNRTVEFGNLILLEVRFNWFKLVLQAKFRMLTFALSTPLAHFNFVLIEIQTLFRN